MAINKHMPGCICCGRECVIFFDEFTDADGTAIRNGWTQTAFVDSGTWTISSNTLTTSDSNAEIRAPAIPTTTNDFTHGGAISVRMKGGATSVLKPWIGGPTFTIGGNAVFTTPNGTLTCSVASLLTADAWHLVEIIYCNNGGSGTAGNSFRLFIDGTLVLFSYISTPVPDTSGLATGAVAGAVYFDDYKITRFGNIEEVYTFNRTGSGGNTHYFTIDGNDTSALAYNADAATTEAALEGLGYGNVTVTGTPPNLVIAFDDIIPGDLSVTHTGGTATLTKTEEGADCPACESCAFWPTNLANGWTAIQAVMTGYTGADTDINGTWDLDVDDCANVEDYTSFRSTTAPSAPLVSQPIECRCYTLPISLTISGKSYTQMAFNWGKIGIWNDTDSVWRILGQVFNGDDCAGATLNWHASGFGTQDIVITGS